MQDIKALMEVMRDGRSKEDVKHHSPSSALSPVEKKWKVNLPSLLKFAQIENIESLAPIWSALEECKRKEERIILQAALDDFSLTTKAATNAKLVVGKELCSTAYFRHFLTRTHHPVVLLPHLYQWFQIYSLRLQATQLSTSR